MLNSKKKDTLRSIEISHLFAKSINHGLERSSGKWMPFEPTRFIYGFFAFNMLYEIDWDRSMDESKIRRHREQELKAKHRIHSLLNFIHETDAYEFENSLLAFDPSRELYNNVHKIEHDGNVGMKSWLCTGRSKMEEFLIASKRFSMSEMMGLNDHIAMIEIAYAVRNNLFHGEKKAEKLKEAGHRKRLKCYGDIILATNESLFNTIKKRYGYRRTDLWELEENI